MMGQEPVVTTATPPKADAETSSTSNGTAAENQVVLHLASYRSAEQAREGWTALRGRYAEQLEGMEPQVQRVDLGPGKGDYWRLTAGPVDVARAKVVCGQLEALGQYCKTAFPEG